MPRRKAKTQRKVTTTKKTTKKEVDGCTETLTPVTKVISEEDLELPSKVRMR